MNFIGSIKSLHRSMLAQMALLTFIFLSAFIYLVLIAPVLEIQQENSTRSPIENSQYYVELDIRAFLDGYVVGSQEEVSDFESLSHIKKALTFNPGFKYYVRSGNKQFSNHEHGPQHLNNTTQAIISAPVSNSNGVCSSWLKRHDTTKELPQSYALYSNCNGKQTIVEFTGITTPFSYERKLQDWFPDWAWNSSQDFLILTVGILGILMITIVGNLRSIRQVIKVANEADTEHIVAPLPENEVPLEVLPLVQSVNKMLSRIQNTIQKHDFFLSTAAHEMRTPLAALRTQIETLADKQERELLTYDVKRLINLVNQLLKLMKTGEPRELTQTLDVIKCARQAIEDRALTIVNKNLDFEFIKELDELVIPGDADLLGVAFANLLDNAISFSKSGDRLVLKIHADRRVTIQDQGPGINSKLLPKLFEPFAKFPPNRDGHGLGLAIVHSVTKLHNANIEVANNTDCGCIFTISFP